MAKLPNANSKLESAIKQASDKRRRGKPSLLKGELPPTGSAKTIWQKLYDDFKAFKDGMIDSARPVDDEPDDELSDLLDELEVNTHQIRVDANLVNDKDPDSDEVNELIDDIKYEVSIVMPIVNRITNEFKGKYYWSDVDQVIDRFKMVFDTIGDGQGP